MDNKPFGFRENKYISPKKLLIYGAPKIGKTELTNRLGVNPGDALIVDNEDGTGYVPDHAHIARFKDLEEFNKILLTIDKNNKPYKFGVLDTITTLEELAIPLANEIFKQTPAGRKYCSENVLKNVVLEQQDHGAGYRFLREAMNKLLAAFVARFEYTIFVAHVKDAIKDDAALVNYADLDLTGKIKRNTAMWVDAIGFMQREKYNLYVNWKALDIAAAGARPKHLTGKMKLSEMKDPKDPNSLETYWDKVYPDVYN